MYKLQNLQSLSSVDNPREGLRPLVTEGIRPLVGGRFFLIMKRRNKPNPWSNSCNSINAFETMAAPSETFISSRLKHQCLENKTTIQAETFCVRLLLKYQMNELNTLVWNTGIIVWHIYIIHIETSVHGQQNYNWSRKNVRLSFKKWMNKWSTLVWNLESLFDTFYHPDWNIGARTLDVGQQNYNWSRKKVSDCR